jgi:pteridine reductase
MSANTSSAKSVFITGAAKRVGAATAKCLHDAGCNIVIHCNRSRQEADALARQLNQIRAHSAQVVQGDLLADNALKGLVAQAASCFGRLDGLVNNASSFFATPLGAITEDDWLDLIGSNLKAPLFLSQAAAPYLKQSHGSIVNIVDIHVDRPLANHALYNTAKSGLAGLTRALALDMAPEVRVNGVSPGAIQWPDDDSAYPPAERERIVNQVPLKRVGSVEDIARTVKFLIEDAPYITGQIIAVDGGRSVAM